MIILNPLSPSSSISIITKSICLIHLKSYQLFEGPFGWYISNLLGMQKQESYGILLFPFWSSPISNPILENGARTPKKGLFFEKGSGRFRTLGRIRIGRIFTLFGRQKTRFGRVQGLQGFCHLKKRRWPLKKGLVVTVALTVLRQRLWDHSSPLVCQGETLGSPHIMDGIQKVAIHPEVMPWVIGVHHSQLALVICLSGRLLPI